MTNIFVTLLALWQIKASDTLEPKFSPHLLQFFCLFLFFFPPVWNSNIFHAPFLSLNISLPVIAASIEVQGRKKSIETNVKHIELLLHWILYSEPNLRNRFREKRSPNTAADFNRVLLICISWVTKLQLFILMEWKNWEGHLPLRVTIWFVWSYLYVWLILLAYI